MKKIFFCLSFLLMVVPAIVWGAKFEEDLYMGMSHNADVEMLQQFLRDQGLYTAPVTGNFFSHTLQALIAFQKKEGIVPAKGYFGIKTRSKVNTLVGVGVYSHEEQVALLRKHIQALQAQLADLIAKQQSAVSVPVPTPDPLPSPLELPSPSPSPTPLASSTPSVPVVELRISGGGTQAFPDVFGSQIKLGDITISNTFDHPILFNQFKLDIYDAMNSARNRNKTVIFKLRDGTTTFDTLISQTNFDISNDSPPVGGETRKQLNVSFPMTIQSGQTHVSSLWLEGLDYVTSGSLRIELLSASFNDSATLQGSFTFILTKE